MTVSISIHPQAGGQPGSLEFSTRRQFLQENANSVTLCFSSKEAQHRLNSPWRVENEINLYRMSDTDAEILASVGLLDAAHRAELLPILRHMLDNQRAKEEANA